MKDEFFLNHDFFDFWISAYRNLFADVYLHVISRKRVNVNRRWYYLYRIEFCVKREYDSLPVEWIPVFSALLRVCNRKIQLDNLRYLIDSAEMFSRLKNFPCSPAWYLPCTRYTTFLNRCILSLRVYRDKDYI